MPEIRHTHTHTHTETYTEELRAQAHPFSQFLSQGMSSHIAFVALFRKCLVCTPVCSCVPFYIKNAKAHVYAFSPEHAGACLQAN